MEIVQNVISLFMNNYNKKYTLLLGQIYENNFPLHLNIKKKNIAHQNKSSKGTKNYK